jgi:N-acetylmuramoyl-L-alanine amidase
MPTNHQVKQGEHISCIAKQNGFSHFRSIWDRPENAALKKLRNDDPHVLFPGDVLFIPDRQDKKVPVPAGTTHTFQLAEEILFLRLRIRNLDNELLDRKTMVLLKTVRFDFASRLFPDDKGIVEEKRIPHCLKQAESLFQQPILHKMDLKIGALDPADTWTGQRARLNNLGYPAGFTEFEKKQFTWAVEEFKCDQKLPQIRELKIDVVKGVVNDPAFVKRLREAHGC